MIRSSLIIMNMPGWVLASRGRRACTYPLTWVMRSEELSPAVNQDERVNWLITGWTSGFKFLATDG